MAIVRTMGIDPALRNTGLCLSGDVPKYLLVTPSRLLRGVHRLVYILEKVEAWVEPGAVDLVAIESYNYKGQNLAELGEALGVLKVWASKLGAAVLTVAPAQVKKFATGTASADKDTIMARYGLGNEHLADAHCLADIAMVYGGGRVSTVRHELEVVKALQHPEKKPRTTRGAKVFQV